MCLVMFGFPSAQGRFLSPLPLGYDEGMSEARKKPGVPRLFRAATLAALAVTIGWFVFWFLLIRTTPPIFHPEAQPIVEVLGFLIGLGMAGFTAMLFWLSNRRPSD
jgi:uncharacterized membrane protein